MSAFKGIVERLFGKKRTKFEDTHDEEKPKALRTKFVLNESEFEKFDKTFRGHQGGSIESTEGESIGQIILPTGCGKTYVQGHLHVKDMINETKANRSGVYVIATPRLLLNTQLFDDILDLSIKCGLKAAMIYLGSGRYNFSSLRHRHRHTGFITANIDGESTTSGKRVVKLVTEAQAKNNSVIIVTTYHSFHRLSGLDHINICTFDEAHTIVGNDQFIENIKKVKEKIGKEFFFTATKKTVGANGGQADEKFFGKVLYEMSPREAIEKGEIVRPRLHFIDDKINDKGDIPDTDTIVQTIISAFRKHKKEVAKSTVSYTIYRLGSKLLVTFNGLKGLHAAYNNKKFQKICKDNNIRTFAFSSDEGEYVDFKKRNRQQTLNTMRALKDDEDAIILHYDILTLGIDLPSMTGLLLLRNPTLSKLIQLIGRILRLHPKDREDLYSGKILPTDFAKMIKPYGWILLPQFIDVEVKYIEEIVKSLRETYNISIEIIGEEDKAIADTENFVSTVIEEEDKAEDESAHQFIHKIEELKENILMKDLKSLLKETPDKEKFLKNITGDIMDGTNG